MPQDVGHTRWATFGVVDLREGGFEIFRLDGGPAVNAPSFTATPDEGYQPGVYADAIAAVCGRGVPNGHDVASQIQDLAGAQYDFVLGGDDDRWRLVNNGPGGLTLTGADLALWGWPAGTVTVGASTEAVAPEEWTRGQVRSLTGGAAGFTVDGFGDVTLHGWVDCLVTASRPRGTIGDRDDTHAADCLEHLDNAVNDAGDERVRYSATDEGHICRTAPAGGGPLPLVWADTGTMQALGFDGTETPTTIDGLDVWQANNPPLLAVIPSRPLEQQDPSTEIMRVEHRGSGAMRWRRTEGLLHRWGVTGRLDGQMDAKHNAMHATAVALPESDGHPLTLYFGWPERRRMLPRPYRPTSTQPRYGLLYTGEIAEITSRTQHYRGRVAVWLEDDRVEATHSSSVRYRPQITLRFVEAEDDY